MSIRLSIRWALNQVRSRLLFGACCGTLLTVLAPGCTALHPLRGVPASYLPDQFEGPSRDNKRTIDLSLLVRSQPKEYLVEAGDVLSIYIPRVLGSQTTEVNSVGIEPPINLPSSIDDPPTIGYPITVRDDNTIALPQLPPIPVGGLTLHQVEKAVRKAYTIDHKILNSEEAMVLVSLQRPRVHRVLVVRQEAQTTLTTATGPGSVNIGTTGKGTARTVTLKAYENDVLHALSQGDGVDGLPGLNAENVIYIIRRRPSLDGAFNCPQPMINMPPQQPNLPPEGMPPLQPVSSRTANPMQISPAGRIQTVSHEQPVLNPQPFSSYRGNGDIAGAHSLSGTGITNPTSGHSASGPIIPAQYNQSPQYSNNQYGNVPNGNSQYDNALQGTLTLPPTPIAEGHSWGGNPPEAMMTPPEFNGGYPNGGDPNGGYPNGGYPPGAEMPAGEMAWGGMLNQFDPTIDNPNVIRIPVRLSPGERPNITEDLITLHDGDIIFIDSRETEVFYTAGLLGGGQYTLPRDYDLGVLEAVSIAEGRSMGGGGGGGLNRSIGGVSALNHDVANSASRLAILRTLPNGKRITIEVDLNKAMRYQQENIRIQPGDILFLEYTLPEAICAFTQRYLLEGALFSLAASQLQTNR